MKWRAFGRMPQWVRLSDLLGGSGFAALPGALVLTGEETSATCAVMMPDEQANAK